MKDDSKLQIEIDDGRSWKVEVKVNCEVEVEVKVALRSEVE